jgi:hypothetical protein
MASELRGRFKDWLNGRPDDVVLRKLFAVMLGGTVAVLVLDYLELSDLRGQAAAGLPRIMTEAIPAALPEDGEPAVAPLRKPDRTLSQKMRFELLPGGRLQAIGTIHPGTAKAFAEEIDKRGSYVTTVVLHSPGGSVSDALEMGRLIRKKKFATEVQAGQYCASSCPLVFAGGVERRAGDRAVIGVHQVSAVGGDGSPAGGMAEAQRISAICQEYLRDMDVDLAVWTHAMATPPARLYTFRRNELLTLRLATDTGGKGVAEQARKKG